MAEEIQLCKADGQEWGFRVTGGADFGTPLTIIKINKGSTAERAGLRVGDMIMLINDQPLVQLTHFQATDVICKAGNMCTATVIRGSVVELPQLPIPVPQIAPQNGTDTGSTLPATGGTAEQGELVLPSLLANLINSGVNEQPVDEESALNQQVDQEVADSWDFSLPPQLVVTLKSVTPTRLDGRPTSPWEIVEERCTFRDLTEEPGTTTGQQEKNTPGTTTGRQETVQSSTTSKQETTVAGTTTGRQETTPGTTTGKQETTPGTTAGKQKTVAVQGEGTTVEERQTVPNESEGETEHKEYTDEEIAEMMSGCAEVLVGNCIGVDFQKLPPDADIMKSEVLHVLIDEKISKPEKTLTTFQQRPARPKPRPRGEPAAPKIPYLPLKYKGAPKKKEEEPTKEEPTQLLSEANEATLGSVEIGDTSHEETEGRTEGEMPQEHNEMEEDTTEPGVEAAESSDKPVEDAREPIAADPSDIESQLAEIQNQLAAIIQLPVEIQEHLSFIQTQLSKILEIRAAAEAKNNPVPEFEEEEPIPEGADEHDGETEGENNAEGETEEPVEGEEMMGGDEEEKQEETEGGEEPEVEPEVLQQPEPEPEPEPPKSKKDIQWQKNEEKRHNKPFFPLTPQPRPVQMPSGRHWFKPRDVYTEDFIAETISGKEEIITGTTIGVDFRKFQCSLDHLEKSSVYKMVHEDVERRVPGSFPGREEILRAREDYVSPYKPTETVLSLYKTKNILAS